MRNTEMFKINFNWVFPMTKASRSPHLESARLQPHQTVVSPSSCQEQHGVRASRSELELHFSRALCVLQGHRNVTRSVEGRWNKRATNSVTQTLLRLGPTLFSTSRYWWNGGTSPRILNFALDVLSGQLHASAALPTVLSWNEPQSWTGSDSCPYPESNPGPSVRNQSLYCG